MIIIVAGISKGPHMSSTMQITSLSISKSILWDLFLMKTLYKKATDLPRKVSSLVGVKS